VGAVDEAKAPVTGPDGNWHESLDGEGPAAGSSDRAFGLLFGALAGAAAVHAAWKGRSSALGWAAVATLFLAAALLAPALLGPLNRAWRRLALLLSKVTTPIVMGLLFFFVLTPVGVVMRLTGQDPLRLRFERDSPSYWLGRTSPGDRQTSMTKQF
jgi:Saxitoxin biosynthesis operon protein SxtJ